MMVKKDELLSSVNKIPRSKSTSSKAHATVSPEIHAVQPIRPINFGFLLLEQFTHISFSAAIEPLRVANHLSGQQLFDWTTIGTDNNPIQASDGLSIVPEITINSFPKLDYLFVCSGVQPLKKYKPEHLNYLCKYACSGINIGAVCTGSFILAKAGLLDDYEISIHWEHHSSLQEEFPRLKVNTNIYTIDRDRLTAAGGSISMDMMLCLIGNTYGQSFVSSISEMLVCDRVRDSVEQQKIPLKQLLGSSQPILTDIVELMEANIEEPLELEELAQYVNISRRQIERLFIKYIHISPSRYYLSLRLKRARQLLCNTSMSIFDASIACGFSSASHFTKCYREFFGKSPRGERNQRISNYSKKQEAEIDKPEKLNIPEEENNDNIERSISVKKVEKTSKPADQTTKNDSEKTDEELSMETLSCSAKALSKATFEPSFGIANIHK